MPNVNSSIPCPHKRRQKRNDISRKYGVGVYKLTHGRQIRCIKELISIAESDSGVAKILDCPCGAGRVGAHLSMYNLTNADNHQGVVTKAKRNVASAKRFDVCDIFNLPYKSDSFDLVLTVLMLQHFRCSQYADILREIQRVSRRWAIVTYSNKFNFMSLWKHVRNRSLCMLSDNKLEWFGSYYVKPKTTLSQTTFDSIAGQVGLHRIARRFVLPGISATTVVLLKK
jgi:ubiquinone/menaquinone biosynthesis C-methylase UbiE